MDVLNIVLLLPPAPAARVLVGRTLATLSARSAAAFLRIAVFAPPGGVGDDGRAVVEPTDVCEVIGELGWGEDCSRKLVIGKNVRCENSCLESTQAQRRSQSRTKRHTMLIEKGTRQQLGCRRQQEKRLKGGVLALAQIL